MRVPHEVYHASPRKYDATPVELVYPSRYLIRKVNSIGSVRLHRAGINVSAALRGFEIGLEPLPDNRYATWFCQLCLGQIDLATHKFHVADHSGAKDNPN